MDNNFINKNNKNNMNKNNMNKDGINRYNFIQKNTIMYWILIIGSLYLLCNKCFYIIFFYKYKSFIY